MLSRTFRAQAVAVIIIACASCAAPNPENIGPLPERFAETVTLFTAANTIEDQWKHLPVRGKTEYQIALYEGRIAIRARGRNSASGLVRRVSIDPVRCPNIEWMWRATKIQAKADLNLKGSEDVAASIFILFGDPGFLTNPSPVPTLRYVWTNDQHQREEIIDNPYVPGVVRSLVVRRGETASGEWVRERRNLLVDFQRAFGDRPAPMIEAIALFTDNDQTREPVEAFYAEAAVTCVPD